MATPKTLTFVSRKAVELPVMVRGREPVTTPRMTVTANGQFGFNKLVAPVLDGASKVILQSIDQSTGKVTLQALTEAIQKAFDSKKINVDSDYYTYPLHSNKKTGQVTISGTQLAKFVGYDYKASGNQMFDVEIDNDTKTVGFSIPKGSLTPKPKQERKPRKSKGEVQTITPNDVGKLTVAAASATSGEDMVLDLN